MCFARILIQDSKLKCVTNVNINVVDKGRWLHSGEEPVQLEQGINGILSRQCKQGHIHVRVVRGILRWSRNIINTTLTFAHHDVINVYTFNLGGVQVSDDDDGDADDEEDDNDEDYDDDGQTPDVAQWHKPNGLT